MKHLRAILRISKQDEGVPHDDPEPSLIEKPFPNMTTDRSSKSCNISGVQLSPWLSARAAILISVRAG